jgi:DNA-binding Lrp family transcriptional regulator
MTPLVHPVHMKNSPTRHARETAVLEYIEMRANSTIGEIAKGTRLKEHVARRIVDSLLEQKLIRRYVHLNVYPLGFFEVDLFVSFIDNSAESVESFIRWGIGRDNVCFLAETVGKYHLKIGLTVRSMSEVHEFVETACETFNFPFSEKDVAMVVELYDFGIHKTAKSSKVAALRFGFGDTAYVPSPEDHQVLKGLSRHPELPPSALARHLGLSATTFTYRIQRLEKAGVIAGYRYLFDPLGKTIEFFHATVNIGGVTASVRKAVYNFCALHPNIPFFAEISGSFDFFLCMSVKRSVETLAIVRSFQEALAPLVRTIDVQVYASPTLRKLAKYPFTAEPSRRGILTE